MAERMVHEMVCLYQIDTVFKTAENAVMNKLIPRVVNKMMQESIKEIAENDFELKIPDVVPPLNLNNLLHVPIIKVAKRKFLRKKDILTLTRDYSPEKKSSKSRSKNKRNPGNTLPLNSA